MVEGVDYDMREHFCALVETQNRDGSMNHRTHHVKKELRMLQSKRSE